MIIEFSRDVLQQYSNFMKIRLIGAGLLHEERRTDKWTGRHNEASNRFS